MALHVRGDLQQNLKESFLHITMVKLITYGRYLHWWRRGARCWCHSHACLKQPASTASTTTSTCTFYLFFVSLCTLQYDACYRQIQIPLSRARRDISAWIMPIASTIHAHRQTKTTEANRFLNFLLLSKPLAEGKEGGKRTKHTNTTSSNESLCLQSQILAAEITQSLLGAMLYYCTSI
jgi:hypothetical protein